MIHKHGTKSTMEDFPANKWSGCYNWPDTGEDEQVTYRANGTSSPSRGSFRAYSNTLMVFGIHRYKDAGGAMPCAE